MDMLSNASSGGGGQQNSGAGAPTGGYSAGNPYPNIRSTGYPSMVAGGGAGGGQHGGQLTGTQGHHHAAESVFAAAAANSAAAAARSFAGYPSAAYAQQLHNAHQAYAQAQNGVGVGVGGGNSFSGINIYPSACASPPSEGKWKAPYFKKTTI